MKGYPRVIATKADFEFLLAEPEFKNRALTDLKTVIDLEDDTYERVVSYDKDETGQMTNIVTETAASPAPKWKRLGFESREAALDLYIAEGGK